ncbi:hypothetical protein KPL28_07485 [Clostridium algidicarnis]|uniref:hypothetical protein n=1 Tax=Clostridium algidicarnis TaxID=37659 RepID=UPI001C0A9559|nr:hypothetical protein [Clostridium algidicarnis]MBU3209479.1 hypothetical protein [Clostridium algidicarnis]
MKKKGVILTFTLVIVTLLIISAKFNTVAYFTDAKETESSLKAGTIDIKIIEEFNPPVKDIQIKNMGTKKSYVRVKLIPVWQEEINGQWIDTSLSLENVIINMGEISKEKWIFSEDFYYYKGILESGEITTPKLNINVDYKEDNISEYKGKRLKLRVYADGVQSSNEMYKSIWNLNSLPWN